MSVQMTCNITDINLVKIGCEDACAVITVTAEDLRVEDEGANAETLRSKFNWKSHKMCSVYVSSSKRTMLKNADLISGGGIATADGAPISKRPKEEPASSNTTVKEGIATAEEEVPTSKEVPSVKEEHTEVKVTPAADPKPGPSNPMEALKHAGFNITFNFNCK